MNTLVLTDPVLRQIVAAIGQTRDGLETGVKLFGTVLEAARDVDTHQTPAPPRNFVVLAIVGPGKRATHQPAHYSDDEEHASTVFAALGSAMPNLAWLGEMHVHPPGMTWLSRGDLRTVKELLTGSDDTVHPEEFVAGVMQRKHGAVDIYPYHFTRGCLKGRSIAVQVVKDDAPLVHQARLKAIETIAKGTKKDDRSNICTQSQRGGTPGNETPGHHRLRQWRQRLGAYGRALWHRHADAH